VLLYQAMGAELPLFAHVPLILGPDKKRLSKRHGATSVMEYARQGYLPEAMVNFLALLGWSPGSGNQELFARDELTAAFALNGISGGAAVFNPEKLDWFNQQYIMRLPPDELARRVRPFFEVSGSWNDAFAGEQRAWFLAVLELFRPRAKRLDDFAAQSHFFLTDQITYDEAAVAKHIRGARGRLVMIDEAFQAVLSFDPDSLETALRAVAEAQNVKAGLLIHATRVAMTGKTVSPGLFDVLSLLGRKRVHARMCAAIELAS
jgi:glutamyl/glutaminyl-tRNA synthetase